MHGAGGWSAVCDCGFPDHTHILGMLWMLLKVDCGFSWSYSLTFWGLEKWDLYFMIDFPLK